MGGLLTDIRVGIRSLRRTPGFALTAILTLLYFLFRAGLLGSRSD